MFGISAGEFIIILVVGLIVFGPGKLPEVGRAIGKALREFRKAQAALSATLNEPLDETKKSSSAQSPSPPAQIAKPSAAQSTVTADDVIHSAKSNPIAKNNFDGDSDGAAQIANTSAAQSTVTADDVIHSAKNNPIAKNNFDGNSDGAAQIANTSAAQSTVTADDVIHSAKSNPIVKESSDEKNFNGNPNDVPADDARASLAGAGRGTNGTDK